MQSATVLLALSELELAGHSIHVVAAVISEYFAASQCIQTVATVAAVVVEYFPVAQSVHKAEPLASLYFPATQAVHEPPLWASKPASQSGSGAIQATSDELPTGEVNPAAQARHVVEVVAATLTEYIFAEHMVHTALPLAGLYVPAAHVKHGPPSGPVNPALQMQFVTDVLASSDLVAVGHVVHVAVPITSLYCPIAQAVHVLAVKPVYPNTHKHCEKDVLATDEVEAIGQLVHFCGPGTTL